MCKNTVDPAAWLKPGERLDDLELGGLKIIQDPEAFCFGTDSILLADFARVRQENRVLDLGTGSGALLLLLWGRRRPRAMTGIEIQPAMAEMARRNMEMNGIADRARIIQGDYREYPRLLPKAQFDLVVANPPYIQKGAGEGSQSEAHRIARHEVTATLHDVVAAAGAALVSGGRFCMVHQPRRLAEIIRAMQRAEIEPKRMRLVQPRADKAPNVLLIEGIRGGRSGMQVEPTLSVYDDSGAYTPAMLRIYGREP